MTAWQTAWVIYIGVIPLALWHFWTAGKKPDPHPRAWNGTPELFPIAVVLCAVTWPVGCFVIYLWPDCWWPNRWRKKP